MVDLLNEYMSMMVAISNGLGQPHATVSSRMKFLRGAGIVQMVGERLAARYVLTDALPAPTTANGVAPKMPRTGEGF